jgi:hypothetical protein
VLLHQPNTGLSAKADGPLKGDTQTSKLAFYFYCFKNLQSENRALRFFAIEGRWHLLDLLRGQDCRRAAVLKGGVNKEPGTRLLHSLLFKP